MNDILENLKKMKEEQCPFVNICEGEVKCIDGRYTQGVICLSKKHIECTKIQQLQKDNIDIKKVLKETENSLRSANLKIIELEKENKELKDKVDYIEYCEIEDEEGRPELDPTDLD